MNVQEVPVGSGSGFIWDNKGAGVASDTLSVFATSITNVVYLDAQATL